MPDQRINAIHYSELPPGLALPAYDLGKDVISCDQAAAAKGIPLANELKTIILSTKVGETVGICAVSLPGDRQVSLRKVKRFLKVNQASLAPLTELHRIGLSPGTVCPVLDPVWSLPQLVSAAVFTLEFVSTNNNTQSRFLRFPPHLLLQARNIQVGEFEK